MSDAKCEWDVFVSHASEDKEAFARPLAKALRDLGLKVWFDEFTVKPGDSLTDRVNHGLENCACGIIILSPAFMRSRWTKFEQRNLLTRYITTETRIVPIWLGVKRDDVVAYNGALADLFAIDATSKGVAEVALRVLRIVRPSLFEIIRRSLPTEDYMSHQKPQTVRLDQIRMGPIRHETLPQELVVRIRNIHFVLQDLFGDALSETMDNFRRDIDPEKEVRIWERVIAAYYMAVDSLKITKQADRKELLGNVLSASMFNAADLERHVVEGKMRHDFARAARDCWIAAGNLPR